MTTMLASPIPNPVDVALGANIRRRRKALGLSQAVLGQSVGVVSQQIQKYEKGYNGVAVSRLVDIANAMGCRVEALIGEQNGGVARGSSQGHGGAPVALAQAPRLLEAYAAAPGHLRQLILELVQGLAEDFYARRRAMGERGDPGA